MIKQKISNKAKKNLLDLSYSKYLQYFNTAIIILFTYIIGLLIAFFTTPSLYKNNNTLGLITMLSIAIITTVLLLLRNFKDNMENVREEIRKLK